MTSSDQKVILDKLISLRSENLTQLRLAHGSVDVNAMEEAIKSIDKVIIEWSKPKYIPYQLCPKCFGDGHLGRHNSPAIASTTATPLCDVCNGKKVIPQYMLPMEAK